MIFQEPGFLLGRRSLVRVQVGEPQNTKSPETKVCGLFLFGASPFEETHPLKCYSCNQRSEKQRERWVFC
jgi:hypothetical protein